MARSLVAGNSLEPHNTKCASETGTWPRMELGYSNNLWGLDNPHGNNLQTLFASPMVSRQRLNGDRFSMKDLSNPEKD